MQENFEKLIQTDYGETQGEQCESTAAPVSVEENFEGDFFEPCPLSEEELAKKAEKEELRKTANTVALSSICISVISILFSLILQILFTNITNEKLLYFLANEAILTGMDRFLSCFCFTVPFVYFFKKARFHISSLMSFKKPQSGIPLYFLGVAVCAFSNLSSIYVDAAFSWIKELIFNYFGMTAPPSSSPSADKFEGPLGFLLSVISTAIIPALFEEFAYRGIVLGALRKFGDGFAVVVSAICFSLMHSNFDQIPFAFAVGLILGFSVIKTGSMWIAILIHFTNNLQSVLFSYLPQTMPIEQQNVLYVALLLIFLGIGILFAGTKQKGESIFTLKQSSSLLSEGQKYFHCFFTLGMIFFIVLSLAEAVLRLF